MVKPQSSRFPSVSGPLSQLVSEPVGGWKGRLSWALTMALTQAGHKEHCVPQGCIPRGCPGSVLLTERPAVPLKHRLFLKSPDGEGCFINSLGSQNQGKDFLLITESCACYHTVRVGKHFFPFLPWLPGNSDGK